MRNLLLNPTTTLEEDLNSKFLIYSQNKPSILLLYGRNNMEGFLLYSNYHPDVYKFFIKYQIKKYETS